MSKSVSEVNALIARAMPATARMVRDWRRTLGDAHVTECVRRGLAGQAGWFFAREGAIAVGTPWGDDPDVLRMFAMQGVGGSAFVMLRPAGLCGGGEDQAPLTTAVGAVMSSRAGAAEAST